ncbi:galactose-1-phosphate uridylyltransferase [Pseudoclavibacter chungangensis]|uniref:Galactose-1-phosphate uridylyltransferase n=1 Tax=Pseudoclavibacter chungangensis TaxID=587635 RepID=A0A7J5BQU5_9MICO|nr:galactose-1-phosphate uridylyltransferase [Pseudoclavibacter chungangensis]KAB1653814.1 galactose-1-phosphate uridylyltransferase [Pseudoclavibacter chungangensis]NYJ68179.1 UDPglucose--hexose-1-phosphate uridylyltransferase [Pseudoclavibacter chungangensis]
MTRVTRTRMADGRELLYFDEDTSPAREPSVDTRELPPRPATPELRQDALTGEWITIATARQGRVHLPAAEFDPLAPQSADNPSEVPDDYEVAVFENRSPSFGPELGTPVPDTTGIHLAVPATGRCEVVCFAPDRTGSFSTQTVARARTVIDAWAHRTDELQRLEGIEQVFVFENRGVDVGVTLHHPHGQIYAYPYVTPRTKRVVEQRAKYGAALQAEVLAAELAGPRVVAETPHWAAFVPFAARWPLELHVMPKRQVPDLAALDEVERDELAILSIRLLGALDRRYDRTMPYIAAWHQAPVRHRDVHLTWQITSPLRAADRLKFLAGSEAAMGAWVGDIAPERQADALREALARFDAERPLP